MATADLIRKLGGFFPVRDQLKADFAALAYDEIELAPGQAIIRAGDPYTDIYLIQRGWMLRLRHMPDGARQIVNVGLPGDFLCFNTLMFETSQFDITAKTDAVLWRIKAETLRTMMHAHTGLAEALVWANAHEEALLAERVVSLGRRDATERLAHVLCEIVARLALIDRKPDTVLSVPLIQEDFADILGISVIHIVRTFKRLAELGAVEYRSRKLILKDTGKLREIAGFSGEYLYFSQRKDARLMRVE